MIKVRNEVNFEIKIPVFNKVLQEKICHYVEYKRIIH